MTLFRAALAALLALGLPTAGSAGGLIDNINGLTTDADGRLVRFNGLLIDKDGRVEKRLGERDKRPKQLDYRYDAKGRTLVPGFVDPRADVMALSVALLSLDLTGARSTADLTARLDAYVRSGPGRRWLLGFGWDSAGWTGPLPTAADLDRIVADQPVWLVDSAGEQGVANSAALRLAAAGPEGKTPPGVLTGAAFDAMRRVVPPPAPKDLDAALLKAQAAYLARGITTVGDSGTDIAAWQTYRRAGDRGALRLRIIGYAPSVEALSLVAGPTQTPWLYDGRLRLAGLAIALDGSLAARRAWLATPYADAPGTSGVQIVTGTRLRNQMSRAAMDGFQIVLAAHGDAAVADALAAVTELGDSYGGKSRWRLDGAELLPTGAAVPTGTSVVLPAPTDGMAAMLSGRLGARAPTAPLWQTLLNKGVRVAFSGAGPYQPLRPLPLLAAAPALTGLTSTRPSFEQSLRALTANGAAALDTGGRIGTLAPGEYADFLIVEGDLEASQSAASAPPRIAETWIGGQKIVLEKTP